jgi:hypothetical protein
MKRCVRGSESVEMGRRLSEKLRFGGTGPAKRNRKRDPGRGAWGGARVAARQGTGSKTDSEEIAVIAIDSPRNGQRAWLESKLRQSI